MAKNLGRKYATMNDDERRRFAMKSEGSTDSAPDELNLENPRSADTVGPVDGFPDDEDDVAGSRQ
jgi:hypothetical protein